jgi:hypothetical protein
MADFRSPEDVAAWVAAHSVDALRQAVESGRFANQNLRQAQAWLNARDRENVAQSIAEEKAMLERSVKAAEESASAARASARWAMWAAIIAVAALGASVAQFLSTRP